MSNEITVIINPGQGLAGPQGPTGPAGSTAPLLSDLKAAATTLGRVSVFGRTALQDGYEGGFIWRTGNFTTQAASEPAEGIYVPSNYVAVSAGCWVRDSDQILLTWFNPAADTALALERAINYAAGRKIKVPWNPSGYTVTRQLVITASSYHLEGDGPEEGAGAYYNGPEYVRTAIKYNRASGITPMVAVSETGSTGDTIMGPFVHRNIAFVVTSTQDASLFQFGDPNENPIVGGGTNPKYVFGVQFKGCSLTGVIGTYTTETITRSGATLIKMSKCFEGRIENNSFFGGDTQIEHYGCDKPLVGSNRFISGGIAINDKSNNAFQVQHTVQNNQFEYWGIAAISSSATLTGGSNRFENGNIVGGSDGIRTLTATATVTTDSDSLTFSSAVDNILFPDQSVIRLTDANGIEFNMLVKTVAGTAVTTWGDNTSIPASFAGTGKTVKRIHGMAVLYKPVMNVNSHGCTMVGNDHSSSFDVAGYIYCAGRASMKVVGCTQVVGATSREHAIVCGNQFESASYLNGTLTMVACDPSLVGNHPLIRAIGAGNTYGRTPLSEATSGPQGARDEERAKVLRSWNFVPGYATGVSSMHRKALEPHPGENFSFTGEMVWAWRLFGDATLYTFIDCEAKTLPSVGSVRVRIRAKLDAGGTEFLVGWRGNGASSFRRVLVSGDWKTYTILLPVPTQLASTPTVARALRLNGKLSAGDVLIAGVVIEEAFDLYEGAATYNPPSLAADARATTTVSVPGVALGDYVTAASFSLDPQGIMLRGWVSAADTVTVEFYNPAGASTVDLASGELRVRAEKRSADVA